MSFTNVLTDLDISLLLENEKVAAVLASGEIKTRFRLALPDSIKEKLRSGLGLDLFSVEDVPMMYIRGDTITHIDYSVTDFKNTYLVYLTDSGGKFVVDDAEYDIKKGCGFVFQKGLAHSTKDTGNEGRLMIGPLSDMGFEVGSTSGTARYYLNETDALSGSTFPPALIGAFTVFSPTQLYVGDIDSGNLNGNTTWIIASNSTGSTTGTVSNGDLLTTFFGSYNLYYLYPSGAPPAPSACFLEGSKLLCLVGSEETYVPIEQMRPGTLVKTRLNGFKPVDMIGHSKIYNPANTMRSANRLYTLSKSAYPELVEDLVLTGYHSVLTDTLTDEQRKQTIEHVNDIYVTDNKYRLLACVDDRAQPYGVEGTFPIWHLALENDNYYMNYGIWANGLLVETTSKRYMKELSGMTLV
jgi:hypothetical protein